MRDDVDKMPKDELRLLIKDLKEEMKKAAARLDFEEAASIRDKILMLEGVSD
jgi:excinuclease ABC subunit B